MLYQYAICPFCNKVKAVLDFLDLPYEVVEVSPMSKSQLKSWTEYRKVPVARVGGDEVQDSAVILTHILDRAVAAGQQVPVGFAAEGTEEWVTWADAELAVLLFPNITRTKTKETAERGRCVCMCVCVCVVLALRPLCLNRCIRCPPPPPSLPRFHGSPYTIVRGNLRNRG